MNLALVFDLETTGTDVEKDRIVEFAIVGQELETGAEMMRYRWLINPGIPIHKKASNVHGITDADVMGAMPFAKIAPVVKHLLAKAKLIVGHNIRGFDVPMLLHELIRADVIIEGFPVIVDTMLDARWATADGKMPTLGELAWAMDVPYNTSKAHADIYDVEVTAAAWREGLRLGVFTMPEIEKELAAA